MDTKYDLAFDCFYEGFKEIENKGFLSHNQVNDLKEIISDTLNDFETDEDAEADALEKASQMGEEGV